MLKTKKLLWSNKHSDCTYNHGRRKEGRGGSRHPLDFENFSKKGCFLSFKWEKQISQFWPLLEKFWEKSLVAPPWKEFSDAHAHNASFTVEKFWCLANQPYLIFAEQQNVE